MTDGAHIVTDDLLDRLERLARLRAMGGLSEAEFEREKARMIELANAPAAAPAHAPPAPADPAPARRAWRWVAIAGMALVMIGGAGWAIGELVAGGGRLQAAGDTRPAHGKVTPVGATAVLHEADAAQLRNLPPDRQVDAAWRAVFGSGDRRLRVDDQSTYSYANGKVVWTTFGPVLVASGTADEPTPLSFGTIGIFYLRAGNGPAFVEQRRWPDAATGSPMGNAPEWTVRHDIAANPVIEAQTLGVWQGYACGSTRLIELTPRGPALLANIDTVYDSTGALGPDGQVFRGTIEHVVLGRSFDVRYTGSATLTVHFERSAKGYVRAAEAATAAAAIPTC